MDYIRIIPQFMGQTHYIRTFVFALVLSITIYFAFSPQHESKNNSVGYISIGVDTAIIPGLRSTDGFKGFPETVEQIMERERLSPKPVGIVEKDEEHKIPLDRSGLPSDPNAKRESSYPPIDPNKNNPLNNITDNPQTIGTNWTAATVLGTNPTNALPADNMGAVGPTQFIVAVNGRIVSFDKTTGTADGVINASTNVFFNSVRNGSGTSDPRIRYDRVSQRWFIIIINVSTPNRILLAVSSTGTINGSTTWTFFYISIDTISPPISSSCLADYPTLGIDNSALYIGTNNFCPSYNSSDGYVINKANLIAGTLTVTVFRGLVPAAGREGPYTPQGVDNFDVSSTEGYFIGVSDTVYSRLIIRRVSNPGTVPSISSDISLTVNTTTAASRIRHLGAASNRRLDALDDRLFAACMRNGRLWTAHNFDVKSSGVASYGSGRSGSRWYEIQNLIGTPSLVQSGTIYDNAVSNPLSYWIPSVMVSGQGHAAFIFSSSGISNYVNQSTCGRLSANTNGTTQSVTNVTASSTAYNLQAVDGQRWGDYSYVSLDPNDDMTMWGVMGFCDATNSYGVRVAKLLAPPPPPLISASPNILNPGQSNISVVITGSSANGEGFFDPGSGFTNRISASISGGITVNSITYNSATQVTINVSTGSAAAGAKTITITNPDGQSVNSSVIFDIVSPVNMLSFNALVVKRDVILIWKTEQEINNKGFDIERQLVNANSIAGEWVKIRFIEGNGTVSEPRDYSCTDSKLATGTYNYRLKQIDLNGNFEYFNLSKSVVVGIPNISEISQNYPNPFNPLTKIDYAISEQGKVSILIYDIVGREVARLSDEIKTAGYYTAEFDASALASGVYFYKIVAPGLNKVKKMLVLK
ncbi:MAG: T9SS type A sorting domain-containing protein [Ignavibacteria bacterium]|nr:T9SS type A sorting domain-containing protein [Ignavibacteria bacterium]